MPRNRTANLLGEYDRLCPLFLGFTEKLKTLIIELLEQNGLQVHSVTCRVKTRGSLARKLARPEKRYDAVSDITDVCGIRITTYFADQVDRVGELLRREFVVDEENSLDKRAALDPDRFGYLSMHHVVSFSPRRIELAEYATFAGSKAEIQTRSILQHAWAEIEHDLGYKTSHEVPRGIRRRFSRLAGLLEIVDQEFERIRDELSKYEQEVPNQIARDSSAVPLDKASLTSFMSSSIVAKKLDRNIAKRRHRRVESLSSRLVELALVRLQALGVSSIREVEDGISKYHDEIVAFAAEMLPANGEGHVDFLFGGIGTFYLCYVLAFHSTLPDAVERLVAATEGRPASQVMRTKVLRDVRARAEASRLQGKQKP